MGGAGPLCVELAGAALDRLAAAEENADADAREGEQHQAEHGRE